MKPVQSPNWTEEKGTQSFLEELAQYLQEIAKRTEFKRSRAFEEFCEVSKFKKSSNLLMDDLD